MKRRRLGLHRTMQFVESSAMSTSEITKSPHRKSARVADKAAELKAAGEAKRPQPPWLRQATRLPAKPEVETTPSLTRERAADRLLSKSEICALTGFSYPVIWGWMREGRFPRSRVIGSGGSSKSVWLSSEIEDWMQALPLRRLKGDPPPSSEVA
jgi:predicted DNA-binding transcriptional regulator AlpA